MVAFNAPLFCLRQFFLQTRNLLLLPGGCHLPFLFFTSTLFVRCPQWFPCGGIFSLQPKELSVSRSLPRFFPIGRWTSYTPLGIIRLVLCFYSLIFMKPTRALVKSRPHKFSSHSRGSVSALCVYICAQGIPNQIVDISQKICRYKCVVIHTIMSYTSCALFVPRENV